MSLFPTNTLVNNLHTFTYADMIGDMDVTPSGIALLNPPSGVLWDERSFLTRGKITHGSSLTPGYLSGMSDSGALASSIWWNAVAPWITVYPLIADSGVTNGVTNAYVKLSKIRGYFWSISAQKWIRIGPEGNGLPFIPLGKIKTDSETPYGPATTIHAKDDGAPAYLPWHGGEQVRLHNPIMPNTKFPDIGGDDITGTGGSDCGGLFIICQTQLCSINNEPFVGGDGIPKYAASIGADYYPSIDSAYNTTVLAGRVYLQAAGGSKFKRIPVDRSPVMHYFVTGVGANTWVSNDSAYTVANGLSSMYQSAPQLQNNTPVLKPNTSILIVEYGPAISAPILVNIPTIYSPTVGYSITDVIVPILTNTTTVYTPTVDYGAQNIDMTMLVNTPTLYSPDVAYNTIVVDAPMLTNPSTLYAPIVEYNALSIDISLLVNTPQVYAPDAVYDSVIVDVSLLTNIASEYVPTIEYGVQTIDVSATTNTPTVYAPLVDYGAQNIDVPLLTNIAVDYIATVSYGELNLVLDLFTNTPTVYAPTIDYGTQTINVPLVAILNDLYMPTVVYSALTIDTPLLTNIQTDYVPTVNYGPLTINTPLLTNTPVDYTPTVSYNALTIDTPLLTNIATDYAPTVGYNALTINVPLLTNTSSVIAPTINYNALTVNVPLVACVNDLYMPTVINGAQTINVPLLTNTPALYAPSVLAPVRAFIGAEGYGAASVGGRGGTVIVVSNLNDSGAGSLRAALTATYPRTIVFAVGGTIDLLTDIIITGANMSYFTVAGQTAPGGGIQTRYKTIEITSGVHDFVIRYLRHRRGWETYTPNNNNHGPGLTLYSYGSPVYNGIIDHCSFAWAQDDTGSWQSVHDITWQWNILSEAKNTLTDGDPPKGTNGKGMISGTEPGDGALMYNMSIHHNFLANNWQRNPLIKGSGPFEIVNNLNYNWGAFGLTIDDTGSGTKVNLIGNYYKAGPDTNTNRYAVVLDEGTQPDNYIYVSDNLSAQRTSGGQPQWDIMGYCGSSGVYCGEPASSSFQKGTPWATSAHPITINTAANTPALVLAGAGAIKPSRDANDARLVTEYNAGTGSINNFNTWPTIASGTPPTDADADGMADSWETANGVTNPNEVAENGYTNLENYLHSLTL